MGELTNDDMDVVQGNYEKLGGRVQERYGYDRETAEKEVSNYFDRLPTSFGTQSHVGQHIRIRTSASVAPR